MTFRPMPVLSVCTLGALIILVLLGNWQFERYGEKSARADVPETVWQIISVEIDTDNGGNAQSVYGLMDGEPVWRRYVPGRVDGSGEIVLVAWDAVSGTQPQSLAISDTGDYRRDANQFFRPAATSGIAARSEPEADLWYGFDSAAMLDRLGYDQPRADVVESRDLRVFLGDDMSRSRMARNTYSSLAPADPLPPERHFGYALTWWGMALGLIGVYLVFHHSQGRLRFRAKR